jgi:hypothetical protein
VEAEIRAQAGDLANVKLFRKLPQSTKSLRDSRDWGLFLLTSLPKGLKANKQPPHDAK